MYSKYVLLIAFATACATTPTNHSQNTGLGPSPVLSDITEESHVLVDATAWLYLYPDENSERIRFLELPADQPAPEDLLMRFQAIEKHGDFLEVRTLDYDAMHRTCTYLSGSQDHRISLRFFIPKEAVHPVLTDDLYVHYEDGTGYALPPGTALFRTETPDIFRVHLGPYHLHVPVDSSQVGLASIPAYDLSKREGRHTIGLQTELQIGDQTIAIDPFTGSRFPPPSPYASDFEMLPSGPHAHWYWDRLYVISDDQPSIVSYQTSCGTLWLNIGDAPIEERTDHLHAGLIASLSYNDFSDPRLEASNPSPIFHEDGSVFGDLSGTYFTSIPNFDDVREDKNLICNSVQFFDSERLEDFLAPQSEREFQVCWRAEDLAVSINDGLSIFEALYGDDSLRNPFRNDDGPRVYQSYIESLSLIPLLRVIQCEKGESRACAWLHQKCKHNNAASPICQVCADLDGACNLD